MNTSYKKIVPLFFFAGLFTSCSDLLDIDPLNSFTDSAVWSDLALAETNLNQQYLKMEAEISRSTYIMYCNFTDEAYHMHGYGTQAPLQGQLSPDKPELGWRIETWKNNYSGINGINLFMQKMETVDASGSDITWKNELKGQGFFLRAWFYSELYKHYGAVPLIKKTYELEDNFLNVKRAPIDEVAQYIVEQCDSATKLLPVVYADKGDLGRATKGAALALKARTLLYAASPLFGTPSSEKWLAAANANKAVIDLKKESGEPAYILKPVKSANEYAQMFTDFNNPEIILQKLYSKKDGPRNWIFTYMAPAGPGSGFQGWGAIQPSQKIVDAFEMEDGTPYTPGDKSENPYLNREWRFYSSIIYDGSTWGFGEYEREVDIYTAGEAGVIGGQDGREGPNYRNATQTGYYMRKFLDREYDTYGTEGNTTPWIFMRLAEFYLNYAESQIELGETTEALKYINLIRNRVNLPNISADNIRIKYEHERMVELVFEGQRWGDLRRCLKSEQVMNENVYGMDILKYKDGRKEYIYREKPVQTRKFVAPQNYWIPIPRSELQKAPLLDPAPYK